MYYFGDEIRVPHNAPDEEPVVGDFWFSRNLTRKTKIMLGYWCLLFTTLHFELSKLQSIKG